MVNDRTDMSITEAIKLANIYEISLDNLFEINKVTMKEYIEFSEKFLKCKNITLEDKVKIIELIRDTVNCQYIALCSIARSSL